jgi:SAM-dependent methyltransferase
MIGVTAPSVGCRSCGAALTFTACDFGDQPLANRFLSTADSDVSEPRFPLRLMVCESCLLVQLEQVPDPAMLFAEYSYLSSVSSAWLAHGARFAAMAVARFALDVDSLVVEVGSNDGGTLRSFIAHGIPCLGIDPAANVAEAARRDGIPTRTAFFGEDVAASLAAEGQRADLLIANNVLGHVPDLRGFVGGLARVLAPGGVLSVEVPHVLALLRDGQFDTIYHEHVSYFSVLCLQQILAASGLVLFDVETLPTHGGSLRLLAQHAEGGRQTRTQAVAELLLTERRDGLDRPERYRAIGREAVRVAADLRGFLDGARAEGWVVAAYGAAAKGTMLLNAVGARPDDVAFVADANPLKQGKLMPGSRIPVTAPAHLGVARPDALVILPWNIAEEIMQATAFIGAWGGRFVVPSPELFVCDAPCA